MYIVATFQAEIARKHNIKVVGTSRIVEFHTPTVTLV